MTVLHEQVHTTLSREATFSFVADFANAPVWDPGTATSARLDEGPVRVGSRYRLGVRVGGRIVLMVYEVTAFEPPHMVVLRGTGRGIRAVDRIEVSERDGATRVDYTADIQLVGFLRPLGWFAAGALEQVGRAARDGMDRALRVEAARS
jgi:carbon monoxide dehydrogenase subunit G